MVLAKRRFTVFLRQINHDSRKVKSGWFMRTAGKDVLRVLSWIGKRLRSSGIDSKESIPPAYVGLSCLPPGYIGWLNRFLCSLNVCQFWLWCRYRLLRLIASLVGLAGTKAYVKGQRSEIFSPAWYSLPPLPLPLSIGYFWVKLRVSREESGFFILFPTVCLFGHICIIWW